MKKRLSICIDMGAVNNGVYYVKYNDKILDKKAINFKIDKDKINFSKKSRRENRHRVRNYTRRKLAKRFFAQLFKLDNFTKVQKELIFGLFNNRGFTFLSSEDEFTSVNETTQDFIKEYLPNLKGLVEKEDFEEFLSQFEDIKDLEEFIVSEVEAIDKYYKANKANLPKDYQEYNKELKADLKNIRDLFLDILKELKNGAKPRKKYLKEIKEEIEKFYFIGDKESFYNLVGNISNLQLRVLRKLINTKENQFKKLKNYFLTFHYNTEDEKRRKELFEVLNSINENIETFLKTCNPLLTIPPYEDMNNRNTYKCNSLHLKIKLSDTQKKAIKAILISGFFGYLKDVFNEEIEGNETKYLQRFLDVKISDENRVFHPRNVFKFENVKAIKTFVKLFGKENYEALKDIATLYYEEEAKIINGIFDEKSSIFKKCNQNTPYKNNIKETLLKPLYSYEFSKNQAEALMRKISDTKGLKSFMEFISKKAKEYQNRFYYVVADCMDDNRCINDKEIKKIVKNLESKTNQLKEIVTSIETKGSFFDRVEKIDKTNLKRVINIFKQTYEILFKDIHGFNKTCKYCTVENNIRSSEENVVAKRLLSDVAKPIDGMLDMMLDRLAFEIVDKIESLEDIKEVEVFIEQNRFEFEEGLSSIKGKKSSRAILKEIDICPYTGEKISKGEYDHILAQSKELFNSKANLIYTSIKGNKDKSNDRYTLDNLNDTHLEKVFKTRDKEEIKEFIKEHLKKIDEDKFVNFDNLALKQQIAFRYALFLDENSQEFKKAKRLLLKDKIRTFTNGTQKRLIKLIYQKLQERFGSVKLNAKVISSELVSATRTYLSVNQKIGEINHLFKEENQDSHSHCIDAMVLFFLATAKLKGQQHRQREYVSQIEPRFEFDEIYLDSSKIDNITKRKSFINSTNKEIASYKLFDDTVYAEHYKHIYKDSLKKVQFELLIYNRLLYVNQKGKKHFVENYNEIEEDKVYKIDVERTSNLIYKLFRERNKEFLSKLKFLDKLRYATSKKAIEDIFFDKDRKRLLNFDEIKHIPPYSQKTFKAIYNKLKSLDNLFVKNEDKTILNEEVFNAFVINLYKSKQKNPLIRKRGKKRHKYSLPILGAPKFRVKRGNIWQVYGNKNIASKNYIINEEIKPIPFFSKNVIPLKISDLIDCLLVDNNTPTVYEVDIDVSEVKDWLNFLKYYVTEKSRCTVRATFKKSAFDIDFEKIEIFDGKKDKEFKRFLQEYLENKELLLNSYAGAIRDGLNAKASVLFSTKEEITLEYKAGINKTKKELILKNLK